MGSGELFLVFIQFFAYTAFLSLLNRLCLNPQFFSLLLFQFFPLSHKGEVREQLDGDYLPTAVKQRYLVMQEM